ncbi:site-specific integrase [Prevotellamassilia timonensis]|uniref:tyrosine-type recombinase/integrase n=1 Tax=Prevotellamassilia timonensis TaxID=1852370 RepID=UPI0023F02B20|nr:site-specific integrase [Prevotellamassilia timonensis]MDD7440793.1 site-specific integrase [Prevotellamassilia timonensis]
MAYKIKWYLDLRRTSDEGKGRLYMVIYNNGTAAQIATGLMLHKEEFEAGKVVGVPMAGKLTQMLGIKRAKLQLDIEELAVSGYEVDKMKAAEIKKAVMAKRGNDGEDGNGEGNGTGNETAFGTFAEKFIARRGKEKTRQVYEMTLRKMGGYCDVGRLRFADISVGWLRDFEQWLGETCSVNTRGIHLRNIRAVMNAAIDEGVVPADLYPFRRFKIKKEETMKRSLPVGDLRRLRDYPCEGWQRKYVDVFMLSFYLAGINLVDLMGLPPLGADGVIRYRRSKTGVLCQLSVPPEARAIIERYRGERHLLWFGERLKPGAEGWHDWLHRFNEGLQKVGPSGYMYVRRKGQCGGKQRVKVYNALFPELTSYWARHTWATLAAEIDVPDAVIDAALGHRSPCRMADIYIRRDARKVDEAVRRVIEYFEDYARK